MVTAMSKTWFITGASRGFGRTFVEAALDHGDNVVGTARDIAALADLRASHPDTLLPVTLDVTDKAAVDRAVQQTVERFGRLDVVVNNAGYGLFGAVEEITGQQLRDQLETNLFGALWVTQAALPIMREQGAGHIVQVSSVGGVLTFPLLGGYHASKWALEGLSDSLAQEVGRLRHQGHPRRARALCHRLGRRLGHLRRHQLRLRPGPRRAGRVGRSQRPRRSRRGR